MNAAILGEVAAAERIESFPVAKLFSRLAAPQKDGLAQ